jgi:CRISPR-associated protein Cst2
MSKHLFGMILTHQGIFANNRGENEGNSSTLQKVLRNGELFTTVSAESIRYAIREGWQSDNDKNRLLNRTMPNHRSCIIQDNNFTEWTKYLDDDVLGFMHARRETTSRRGILEITRAISTTPWRGELIHNFASPGSNPAVSTNDPIPYAVEIHDTRYQFGFAMTPEFLGREGLGAKDTFDAKEKRNRLTWVLNAFLNLRRVGGNHARYFSDYSPEAIILRWTDDPAPRFLYCFEQNDEGFLSLKPMLGRIKGGDIDPTEVIIGTALDIPGLKEAPDKKSKGNRSNILGNQTTSQMEKKECVPLVEAGVTGVTIEEGVKKAVATLLTRINDSDLCPE